MTTKGS